MREKRTNLIFLMETKFHNKNLYYLRIKLQYDSIFVVDKVGQSGGLILLWRDDVWVVIQNYSRRYINALVKVGREGMEWKFSGFYGHLETARRKESWSLLRYLSTMPPIPWLCMGDFNEIVNVSKK